MVGGRGALLASLLCALAACGGGGGGGPAGAPHVISVSPAPGAATGRSPAEIVVRFDRDMDTATITRQTFLLTWSGGDGTFADGNEVTISAFGLTFPNARTATLPLGVIPDEIYRLTLVGTGIEPVTSVSGDALDGEFFGALPSGNGVPGGDFVIFFSTSTVVSGMTPAPGSIGPQPPGIVVQLSADTDPATVTAQTFRVLRSGGDGTFHDGDEVALTATSIAQTGPGNFTFGLSGQLLPPDTYQVTLSGAGAGGALRFDGIDDLVSVAASLAFAPGAGSWTVECWMAALDNGIGNSLASCADGDFFNGWRLGQDAGAAFFFEVDGTAGTRRASGGSVPLAPPTSNDPLEWHHVAGVYDAAAGATHLYVDGALTASDLSGPVTLVNPAADLFCGRLAACVLDEVRIWSLAKSGAGVARDRFRALPGAQPGLQGYWNLDEPFGQPLVDLSAFANTGSLGADSAAAADDPARIASTAWPRVRDLDGNPLDGTFTGTLPSGTGSPGADFVATFRIG